MTISKEPRKCKLEKKCRTDEHVKALNYLLNEITSKYLYVEVPRPETKASKVSEWMPNRKTDISQGQNQ